MMSLARRPATEPNPGWNTFHLAITVPARVHPLTPLLQKPTLYVMGISLKSLTGSCSTAPVSFYIICFLLRSRTQNKVSVCLTAVSPTHSCKSPSSLSTQPPQDPSSWRFLHYRPLTFTIPCYTHSNGFIRKDIRILDETFSIQVNTNSTC